MNVAHQGEYVSVTDNDPHHGYGSDAVNALQSPRVRVEGQEPLSVGIDGETTVERVAFCDG